MVPPADTPQRTWPLRVMALVLFALGIVPMANFVTQGPGLQWYVQSVRLWAVWAVVLAALERQGARPA